MVGGENRHNDARSAIAGKNEILISHSQGAMLDELGANLCEVLEMLADEGEP